jgi:hypothetical protein
MAERHHHTMKKYDALRDKFAGMAERFVGTVEVAAGAWAGGAIEGRTDGGTVLKVPINLAAGAALLVAAHFDLATEKWSGHLNNLGNGFVGSYVAATGYRFGKNWKDTGKLFGGHSWSRPYGEIPASTGAQLSEADMDGIVARMQAAAAAAAGAHP